ncbi:unnamed protein product [Ceratitis capitata]|uniref:Tubulin polymerization-promoting protein homolog n=1 Tax=Ceratitis capitata TaxID=7213 RepID=A0A811UX79_CERCA|nr:unnamed protein product [Ceratitis capitata]
MSAATTPAPSSEPPIAEVSQLSLEDEPKVSFSDQFKAFSKFGDIKSDGKLITLSQSDKWMKQAKVIDKKITTTDTGIHFKKFKATKISLVDYNKFLEDLAKAKKVELSEIKKKMASCGAPVFYKSLQEKQHRQWNVSLTPANIQDLIKNALMLQARVRALLVARIW